MSSSPDVNPFDKDTFGLDPNIFGPLLKEDLTSTPPPFQVRRPLEGTDFSDEKAGDSFVLDLDDTTSHVAVGFQHHATFLTREQWLRTTSQLLTAILTGIGTFRPDQYYQALSSDLNPDEGEALEDIGKALHQQTSGKLTTRYELISTSVSCYRWYESVTTT